MSDERIARICAEYQARVATTPGREALIGATVDFFAATFGVSHEEVAIFELDPNKDILHFVVPEKLQKVGFIPLSSLDSLAARTAREVDVFLENTFATLRHAAFFEKFRLGDGVQEPPKPIQKIISVPVLGAARVRGVIQVSRKGVSGDPNIPDFTDEDALLLVELCRLFGSRLQP